VSAPGVIAITGLRTFVGQSLVERLLQRLPGVRIVGLDHSRPFRLDDRVRFHRIDLAEPTADGPLAEILEKEGAEVLRARCCTGHGPTIRTSSPRHTRCADIPWPTP
jgi:nucleoside-diphosphate-sugar epimerase